MLPSDAEAIDAVANNIITNIGTYACQKTLSEVEKKELFALIEAPIKHFRATQSLIPECVEKIAELKAAIESMHEKGADLKSRRLVLKLAEELDQLAA